MSVSRPAPESRIVALVSGLDSAIMAGLLARTYREVTPLFVRAGLRWEDAEIMGLRRYFAALNDPSVGPLVELDLGAHGLYGDHWSTGAGAVPDAQQPDQVWYLPGRNLMLLAQAAIFGAIHEIPRAAIGILASNPFPDAQDPFLRSFERTADLAMDFAFEVLAPLRNLHKADVIRAGQGLPVELALSCADPVDGRHCGVCGKCGERRRGFIAAGVPDPTPYAALGPL